jgi:hypothetical protein
MLQRGFPQVIDFLHRPFGTWIAHLLKQVDGEGAMVRCSVARPAAAQAISVAVDRFE